ncbi:LamG-like jellyroll fold domain-containing protein [Rubritalea halochordaticola]
MCKTLFTHLSVLACMATTSQAALIAHYDFSDGDLLDNEVGGSYTLAQGSGTDLVSLNGDGSASFSGDDNNPAWLETVGPGGAANFTVSLWVKTDSWNQGSFQGLFANNSGGAGTLYSWQIDSNGGDIRVATQADGAIFSTSSAGLNSSSWYNITLIKNGANTEFYLTEEGAGSATHIGTVAANPGGLQSFRLGINRNDDKLFTMDMANVKIFNSVENVDNLVLEGAMVSSVPEPTSTALVGLAGLGFILRRRR